jgi:gamma-glutamyl phosphate reductase
MRPKYRVYALNSISPDMKEQIIATHAAGIRSKVQSIPIANVQDTKSANDALAGVRR